MFSPTGSWILDLTEGGIYSVKITDPSGSISEDTLSVKSGKIDQNKTLYG